MAHSLYELLDQEVGRMIAGIGGAGKGNIYPLIIGEIERSLIVIALEKTNNNYVRAAQLLGISRSTLYRKITLLGLEQLGLKKEEGALQDCSTPRL